MYVFNALVYYHGYISYMQSGDKMPFTIHPPSMTLQYRNHAFILVTTDLHSDYFQELLEGSQGQYIQLERKMREDFGALEKKYHKAKKLIKDYQSR